MESGFDKEKSSLKDRPPLVYLELGNQVATVRNEPLDNISLEDDAELKSNVQKLLGLIATRRRLYTPEEYCAPELEELTSKDTHPLNNSTFSPAQPAILSSTWSSLNLANPHPPTLVERRAKERNDILVETDANIAEMETPDFLKKIDLSELPSREEMASICGRHKSSIACLERHPNFYRFVESLHPTTPINMCHPLALTYRERSFKSCKEELAKTLFNIFNHAIFQCGLHAPIVWKSSLRKSCERVAIDASGQRSAYILLWKKISQPGMLIKMLLHEMCHAAAFVFNRETGHGDHCRR
ncbi:uncharacterized protein LOC119560606 isoform X2 [Drosophila subpulchrella]|nr:uncharacterized protein LOC119560606 isoform X2 [Drosophila subpulchrella]